MDLAEKIAPARHSRPVYEYEIPEQMGGGQVGIVELTAEEELMATKRSRGDSMRLAYELAKQSLVEINGAKLSTSDGSSDSAWNKMPAAVRNLVLSAYAELHSPPEGAVDGFLKSRKVRVA